MLKKNKKLKPMGGFTLLELLIATAIFGAAIVLVVSSFGLSTKHQREVRSNRDISQNIRYASSEISRQIELSYNGPLINKAGTRIQQGVNDVYNFAVTNSPGGQAVRDNLGFGDVLFVRDSDNHCRYYYLDNTSNAANPNGYGRIALMIDSKEGCTLNPVYQGPFYITDLGTNIEKLEFKGTMNTKEKENGPYVWIIINSLNSDTTEFTIPLETRTVATIRNFGREN